MQDLPRETDDVNDWGPSERRLGADERVSARWQSELERLNKGRQLAPLRLPSPLDEMPEMLRVRALPSMPWPAAWPDLGRRCRTYPGDVVGVVGGTGSGKTQFGVQLARGFAAAAAGCVLWAPFELTPSDLNLRIAANLAGTHSMAVRESWSELQIANALATVTDRWRFIDIFADGLPTQIGAMTAAIKAATEIYHSPPLVVIDYVQLMADGEDQRGATADAMKAITVATRNLGCYTVVLSQTSRGNQPALAGKVDVAAAADLVGAGAESSAIERNAATMIVLNVFKADDSPSLDAHWLVSKARHTGLEGKVGARYHKAGGVWEELDHLPATPVEVEAEAKRARKRGASGATREEINAARATGAASQRREAILAAIREAGIEGLTPRAIRRVKGAGNPARMASTLAELESSGRIRASGGRWYFHR